MMIISSLLELLHPINFVKKRIQAPIEAVINRTIEDYKTRTTNGIIGIKELLLKGGIVALFLSSILWISIFLYVAFYYTYMPNITHMRPVHLQFKSCDKLPGVCSYPSAHVQITNRESVLMGGQQYKLKIVLDMPESGQNKDLGMFMVCCQLRSKTGNLVNSACRSVMLRHRSFYHELMRTFFHSPFLLSGLGEEKQTIHVEVFSEFQDDASAPVTDAYIEVQSRQAQIYSASLRIEAHFTGLRYIMFTWPVTSAFFGITSCLFLVSLVFVLSWYHISESGLPDFVNFANKINVKIEKEDADSKGGDDTSLMDLNLGFEGEQSFVEFTHGTKEKKQI